MKNVCLVAMLAMSFQTSAAPDENEALIKCKNNVSISRYPLSSGRRGSSYKVYISNPNIRQHLDESTVRVYSIDDINFSSIGHYNHLRISRLNQIGMYKFEVVRPEHQKCIRQICSSGCYAGDTPVWTCAEYEVVREKSIYKETASCENHP